MSFRKIAFDTAAMSSVNVLRLLGQFLAIPILARLLSPSDYGVVAMAMPFILFAMVVSDAGIGMSLVRTPAGERNIWSTCFWLSILLGLALTALMALMAPIASAIFAEPRLGPIVVALSAVVFIQSIGAIPGAALQQQQKFKTIAIIETIAIAAGIGTAVVIALKGGGAWALVWQQLAFYIVRISLTLWFSAFRPAMHFDLKNVKEHLSFGRDVLSVNLVGFFSRSIDNLIIGKVLASAAVGVYSMAFQFARLPGMLVTGPLQYVLYAKLAQVKDNKPAIRSTFLLLTRILAIIIFPAMGMVAAAYQPVFALLLSEKWAVSGRLFMLVAPACALQAVTALSGTIMLVMGHANIRLRATLELGILWIIALLVSIWFGLDRAAIAYNIVVLLYSPRYLMLVLPFIECRASSYWQTMGVPLLVVTASIVFYHELQPFIAGQWEQLIVAMTLALFGITVSALFQRRILMAEFRILKANSHF